MVETEVGRTDYTCQDLTSIKVKADIDYLTTVMAGSCSNENLFFFFPDLGLHPIMSKGGENVRLMACLSSHKI